MPYFRCKRPKMRVTGFLIRAKNKMFVKAYKRVKGREVAVAAAKREMENPPSAVKTTHSSITRENMIPEAPP